MYFLPNKGLSFEWRCQSRNFVARLGDFFKAFRGDYRDFLAKFFTVFNGTSGVWATFWCSLFLATLDYRNVVSTETVLKKYVRKCTKNVIILLTFFLQPSTNTKLDASRVNRGKNAHGVITPRLTCFHCY